MKKIKSFISLLLAVLMVAGCMVSASAAAVEEKEPNDVISTATAIKAGEGVTGNLGAATDVDYYKYTADVIGLASVTLTHTVRDGANSTYFKVTVLDADEKAIVEFTSAGSSKSDTSAGFTVSKDAVYYVKVEMDSVHDASLDYTVTFTVDKTVLTETEPNNNPASAPAMKLSLSGKPELYYGTLTEGDVDCYKITLDKPGVLNIYLYNDTVNAGNYSAVLETYSEGANGEQELKPVTALKIAKTDASVIGPSVCVPSGIYVLSIKGDLGSYSTRVLYREATNTETEINDTAADADGITLGTTYKATLDEVTDVDYFKFNAAKDNKGYDFIIKTVGEGKWNVRILNSNLEAVDKASLEVVSTVNDKDAKIETYPLAAGVYYIEVKSAKEGSNYNSDIYEISLTERKEALDDGKEEEKSFIDRIKEINWGALWKNFEGWFEQINIVGLIGEIGASLMVLFTFLGSFFGK